ncbi:hypothetical protein D7M15_16230 [Streptomyces sp. Z26]|nr:hypothetical protein D7M15_16230 [Streptomyces sp. Z26]
MWLDVLPNMSRFGRGLSRQLSEPLTTAGRRAGDDAGDAASSAMGDRLKAGAAAIGVAAGAALTAGLTTGLEAERATSKLKAQLNLTGPEAKRAGKVAGDLYAGAVTDSIEEGAAAVKAVMGVDLVDSKASTGEIRKISTAAQDLATMFDQDVTMAAKGAASMVRTGLAKNATQAFDVMTAGLSRFGDKGEDVVETFNEYSPFLKQVGLSAKESLGLMSQALDGGAWDTDKLGDSIKEFTLKATEGSESVSDAFKALGLDGKQMGADIAAGGPRAKGALDDVLDSLREMPATAERTQIVSALFGGPGEDLGAALFTLNVDKAGKSMGDLSGSAQRAGKDLRDNTAVQFEVFKRQALMGLAGVIMTDVVPALRDIAPVAATAVAPVRDLWTWLSADPARMQATATALLAIGGAVAAVKVGTAVVGGLRATVAAARTAGGAIRFAAFALRYYTVIGTASAVTAVRTGAAWTASAVRSGAAWTVARARAGAAMAQTAATAVVHAARTGVTWTVAAVRSGAGWAAARARAVGSFAATAASATGAAARTGAAWAVAQARTAAATARATATLAAQRVAMLATAAGAKILAAGQWLVNAAMRANPIGLVITALVALGAGLVLAYKKSATFRAVVQGAMRGAMGAMRQLGAAGKWLFNTALMPAFRGIGAGARWMQDKAIRPATSGARAAARGMASAFVTAKNGIGKAFGQIRDLAKKPVGFVVNTVYNNGIRRVWNKVAGLDE